MKNYERISGSQHLNRSRDIHTIRRIKEDLGLNHFEAEAVYDEMETW